MFCIIVIFQVQLHTPHRRQQYVSEVCDVENSLFSVIRSLTHSLILILILKKEINSGG